MCRKTKTWFSRWTRQGPPDRDEALTAYPRFQEHRPFHLSNRMTSPRMFHSPALASGFGETWEEWHRGNSVSQAQPRSGQGGDGETPTNDSGKHRKFLVCCTPTLYERARMLILDRKSGQELLVPQYGIVFKIVEIRGTQVRVGISAPPEVKVYRGEFWMRLRDEPDAKEVVRHRRRVRS